MKSKLYWQSIKQQQKTHKENGFTMIPVYNKIICHIRIVARHCEFSCVFPVSTANWSNHLLWSQALSALCSVKEQAALLEISSAGCDTRRSDWQFVCCQPYGERRICTPAYLSLVIFFLRIPVIVFLEAFEFPPHWFPKCTYFSHVPIVIFVLRACWHVP